MRSIALGVCLFVAGCSGQTLDSPTAPAGPGVATAGTPAQGEAEVPFKGSYTLETAGSFAPPATIVIRGTGEGSATHLGQFISTYVNYVDLTTATGTGSITFTAANGDWLRADVAGGEEAFTPPNISHTRLVATVTEGTGRFASATGTFTIRETSAIDFEVMTSVGTGSFEGTLKFGR